MATRKNPKMKLKLNSNLVEDRNFVLENPSCNYGRVAEISFRDNTIKMTFFQTQKKKSEFYILQANSNTDLSLEQFKSVKRGDQIAFVANHNKISKIAIVNHANKPIPTSDSWNSKENNYERLLKRELDVLINPDSMETFIKRNEIIYGIRKYMQRRGFIEVELPILKTNPDIAPAEHFEISNSKNHSKLYLRTTFPAFEKLLLGFDRVYSIGPNFRNGDNSYKNVPEFNMFCMVAKGKDYRWSARLVHNMIGKLAGDINGDKKLYWNNMAIDLGSWQEVSLDELFKERFGQSVREIDSDEALKKLCNDQKVILPKMNPKSEGHLLRANLFDCLFEQKIVKDYSGPTFFKDVPWYLAGPAEVHFSKKGIKMRGEGYVGRMELMNAKNILINYDEIQKWHRNVAIDKAKMNFGEYAKVDEVYLDSVSYGMQWGSLASMGLERLVMLITGKTNIKDVVMYPL